MPLRMKKPSHHLVITLVVFVFAFTLLLFIAQSLSESSQAQAVVAQFGYLGVVFLGVITGLNAIVPVPAATLTPVFIAAGLTVPLIIAALAVGTLIADFTSFFLGRLSRELILDKHPKIFAFITEFQAKHSRWTFLLVTLYAAFAPLPNEIILIPLGLTGVRFVSLIIPLIIGNIIYQVLLVYSVIGLSKAFF